MPAARVNLHLGLYSCDDGAGASLWCLSADPRLWCERRLSVISHIACVLRPTSLTLAAADTGTMKNASLRPLLLLATSVGVCAALFTGCSFWRLGEARALTSASEVFEQHPRNATLRLLVVGDSTAVGTGASSPAGSVAGLLGSRYPKLWVDNGARDGAKFDEVPAQVATANNAEGYDVVLICAGGNDVMRGTDIHALRAAVERSFFVAKAALKAGGLVLVQPAGNVGNAPFFWPPVSGLMSRRSRDFHAMVQTAAARHGVRYVGLYKDKAQDPFAQRNDLHAADGLHPNDAGYAVWRDELLAQSDLGQRLAAAQ
jgi:lysophospholipase L1-like esterase